MWTALIEPKPPYDFARTAEASRFLYAAGQVERGVYRRVLHVGDALALVEIMSIGSVDQPLLEARLLAANGAVDDHALSAKVRRLLNAGCDLQPFYTVARRDHALLATVEALYGLHSFQSDTLFEAVALAIIEQQITLKMAQRAERWLMAWAKSGITYEERTYYTFPSPEQIAGADIETLLPMKITGKRIGAVLDLAHLAASGMLDLEGLREKPFALAYPTLMNLRGVGHWTAAWAITRAFGAYLFVGRADVALRAAANHYFFGQSGRCDPATFEAAFERYGDFAGIAGFYVLTRWAMDRYHATWE